MKDYMSCQDAARIARRVAIALSAIVGAIRGRLFPRPRLRVGLVSVSRVAAPENGWNVLRASMRVLGHGKRVLSCQLSCQRGNRLSRASLTLSVPERS